MSYAVGKAKAIESSSHINQPENSSKFEACLEQNWIDEEFTVLKLDMKNPSNGVSCQTFLSKYMLHTLPRTLFMGSAMLQSTPYDGNISIRMWGSTGELFGPLLFCLVLTILVNEICSDPNCANLSFHGWYLDDRVVTSRKHGSKESLYFN